VRLAVSDDASTPDEDESLWIGHASSETEISKISRAGAIWFTGGDQMRLTQVLLRPDGSDTPMLREIRKRLSDGAVVGGTSAGAAVMGSMMIARGDTLTSLSTPVVSDGDASRLESGALVMARGLGLLPWGLTDQHFDRQARLGRLARAMTTVSAKDRIGYGVDEDTALIVDFKSGRASVAGSGTVTIINAVDTSQPNSGQGFAISGLRVHVLSEGDTYILSSGEVLPADYKTSTRGKEYHDHEAAGGGGMAIPNQRLEDVLGIDLVDNSKAKQLTRVSFGDQGRGVSYRFEKTISTDGFQGRAPDGRLRYTIVNVMFAINPVIVDIRPVQ
jgi:cyanophycinase